METSPALPRVISLPTPRALLQALPWFRPKSAEQLAREAEVRAIREQNSRLQKAATAYASIIRERLTRLGLSYEYTQRSGKAGFQEIKWQVISFNTEAIYLKVDTIRLPRRISSSQIVDEQVLRDLSLACQRPVTFSVNDATGLWYIIELEQNVRGIPHHVNYSDMLGHYPATATGFDIPIGVGANRRYIYRNLTKFPHLLIAGTTGGGKSTWENTILCSLIRRNDPRRLKLLLVDLKGGNELSFYQGVPHLLRPVVESREQALRTLKTIRAIVDYRLKMFRAKYRDIGRYNFAHRNNPLPRILLFIDEWGDMALDRKLGPLAEDLLTGIAQRCRSVGVHIIICTQFPKREVVSTRIKANMPVRVAFSCADNTSSIVILDNGDAHGLTPQGRLIFQQDGRSMEAQAPYVNDELIAQTVADAKAGKFTPVEELGHDVTEQDVLEWALEELSGEMPVKRIWDHFRQRGITAREMETMCKELEGQEVVVAGGLYRVASGGPFQARHLDKIKDEVETGENPTSLVTYHALSVDTPTLSETGDPNGTLFALAK